MGERTSYLPGTPSWVDLGSPDQAASAAFYGGLFGWSFEADPNPEAGGYGMFRLNGHTVAGLGPQMSPEIPPYWAVYVTVADADATAAEVSAAGGQVVAGPFDVLTAGRMAVCCDPQGSFFSIWQPIDHIGATLVNDPGSFGWNQLAATDLAAVKAFYQRVFGWGVEAEGDGSVIFTVDGRGVCGAHTAGEGDFPAWSVWFSVDECDASTAKVTELGGSVLMEPSDMGFGRGAVVSDPQGAVFGLAQADQVDP